MKVFDIEAYEWNRVYAIGIYDGRNVIKKEGNNIKNDVFIEWLLDNLYDGDVVYAHNGGKYDFLFIMHFLKAHKEHKIKKMLIIHGSIVKFVVVYNGKSIEFRDSFAILPKSLRSLTNDFDVLHKKLEMDYDIGIDDARYEEYFNNDLMGLYEVLLQASDLHEKPTLAANALNIFSNDFYRGRISSNSMKINNIFRESYYGGRVEIFKMAGQELNYYDVNSLYPSVMYDFKYPLPIKNNYEITYSLSNKYEGVYKCSIEAPYLKIPLLPIKHDKKLVFGIGSWSGWYASQELRKAKELGYKVNIIYGYKFLASDYIFREYVEHYYKIKKNSKGAKKAIAKLMLNSLYGKFGQRNELESWKIDIQGRSKASMYKDVYKYYNVGGFNVSVKKFRINAPFMHTEIASMITANARLRLYSLIERAGMNNVYYCDTDSIITSSLMNTSEELGDIKEEAHIDKFIAIAPKVYAYTSGDKVAIRAKGLLAKNLKFVDFENALMKHDLSAFVSNFERLGGIKEVRVRHIDFGDKISVKKAMRSIYDKRIIRDNFDTEPVKIVQ